MCLCVTQDLLNDLFDCDEVFQSCSLYTRDSLPGVHIVGGPRGRVGAIGVRKGAPSMGNPIKTDDF